MHWLQVTITPIAALVLSGVLYLYGRHRGHVAERLLVEQFICDLYTWPERPAARMLRYEGDQRRQRLRGAGAQKPEDEGEWVLRHFLADLDISAEDFVTEIELERDAQERER